MAPALLLKGKSLLDDPLSLGITAETAVFKRLFARYHAQQAPIQLRARKANREVDLIAKIGS